MKQLIIVVGLLALAGLGAWLTARYQLSDTMYQVESEIQNIGPGRGGVAPDDETVEERLHEIADEWGVEISEVYVSVEPLTRENMARSGALTTRVQGELDKSVEAGRENTPTVDSEASEVTKDYYEDREMKVTGTLIDIEVHVAAEKWLWSEEEDFTTTLTLR
jgi:hypothetical protein